MDKKTIRWIFQIFFNIGSTIEYVSSWRSSFYNCQLKRVIKICLVTHIAVAFAKAHNSAHIHCFVSDKSFSNHRNFSFYRSEKFSNWYPPDIRLIARNHSPAVPNKKKILCVINESIQHLMTWNPNNLLTSHANIMKFTTFFLDDTLNFQKNQSNRKYVT